MLPALDLSCTDPGETTDSFFYISPISSNVLRYTLSPNNIYHSVMRDYPFPLTSGQDGIIYACSDNPKLGSSLIKVSVQNAYRPKATCRVIEEFVSRVKESYLNNVVTSIMCMRCSPVRGERNNSVCTHRLHKMHFEGITLYRIMKKNNITINTEKVIQRALLLICMYLNLVLKVTHNDLMVWHYRNIIFINEDIIHTNDTVWDYIQNIKIIDYDRVKLYNPLCDTESIEVIVERLQNIRDQYGTPDLFRAIKGLCPDMNSNRFELSRWNNEVIGLVFDDFCHMLKNT
jgi:hypothetical protein